MKNEYTDKTPPKPLLEAYQEAMAERDLRIAGLEREKSQFDFERTEFSQRNAKLEAEIKGLKDNAFLPQVERLISVWRNRNRLSEYQAPVFRDDPVYGKFQIDNRLLPAFFHPLVQRLNYIRQLSFAYLIFPSASHTRLSHTLGVAKNAQAAIRAMFDRNCVYTSSGTEQISTTMGEKERERFSLKTQLCALLHDVGHGPFGHALDTLIPYIDAGGNKDIPDKQFSLKYAEEYFSEEIKQLGFSVDEILCVLDKERRIDLRGYDVLIPDLIDSAGDVDRMDYLVRDAHMTGLGVGYSKPEALIEHMCPFRGKDGNVNVTFEESALPHLENMLYARDIMYINCYEHPRKVCAERLLVRLAKHLLDMALTKEALMMLADGQLLSILSLLLRDGTAEGECLRSLVENRTFSVQRKYRLSRMESRRSSSDPGHGQAQEESLSMVSDTTFNDELNTEIEGWYKLRPKKHNLKQVFITQPKSWEERICADAEVPAPERWKVVVTVPAYEAKQERESAVRLLYRTESGYTCKELFEASDVMKAVVTNLIPSREVIRVLVSEEMSQPLALRVGEAADALFMR
jgi:HD superfamily phosphohydrolase